LNVEKFSEGTNFVIVIPKAKFGGKMACMVGIAPRQIT